MRLSGGRRGGRGGWVFSLVRPVLAIVLLVPIGALFGMVWQSTDDNAVFATLERHGVSYVDALISVELALAESQTAAMTSTPVAGQRLVRALDTAAAIDARYGDELRTHERWRELRSKIETLSKWNGDAITAYTMSEETADLLLALIEKVRTSSRLIRDPDADTYYLQDAAAQELPEAIVASSRLVGLALMTLLRPSADQGAAIAELLSAKAALVSNVADLADDVRQTVDTTDSRTLGGNLLAPLDRFRLSADSLMPAATAMQGQALAVNPVKVNQSWSEAQAAAGALSTVMLAEIDGLLADRLETLDRRTLTAAAVLALAVLLALVPPAVEIGRRRRGRRSAPPSHRGADPREPEPVPVWAGTAAAGVWERSGAAR